ncbi:Peptidase C13 legumain [Carpediemonas membranifera]|uniref:legumain n=1 Tax=Carpediemonas membranifera TaxID=201153 RepID=A0A8J6AXV4_9EUKA|nr:Peptidase C13 legumain [Carpediemonas membranifera]|eukprot:KAG9395150.1 Peptidase C13 legumain [Carpediemonas membranifera]
MRSFLLILALLALVVADDWAVLVAGSNTYNNYRHQSDVYHAYQLLRKNGYPDSRIIVFHYDDSAHNERNPDQGVVINHINGPNVYTGVPKDFTGESVTPDNFLAVLRGETVRGHAKTLKSTANDNVVIYFADHGAAGLVAFPSEYMYADSLMETLNYMHEHRMYKQLVFYMEACESGSMFEGKTLPPNMFTSTAANPSQSSYACYWDSHLSTYLGDVYSVNWLEYADAHTLSDVTLAEQMAYVTQKTTGSQVCQFGDKALTSNKLSTYLAYGNAALMPTFVANVSDAISSRDVDLHIHARRVAANETGAADDLTATIVVRETENDRFTALAEKFNAVHLMKIAAPVEDFDCYRTAIAGIEAVWGKTSDYGLQHFRLVANLCSVHTSAEHIIAAANSL